MKILPLHLHPANKFRAATDGSRRYIKSFLKGGAGGGPFSKKVSPRHSPFHKTLPACAGVFSLDSVRVFIMLFTCGRGLARPERVPIELIRS